MCRTSLSLAVAIAGLVGCRSSGDPAAPEPTDAGQVLPPINACAVATARPASSAGPAPGVAYTEEREPCASRNPERNVYWGELHVHTANSFDAWALETRNTPEDAYRFARGETVYLPPLGPDGKGTVPVKLERPLDFAAVTDHSEALGEVAICTTPGTEAYDSPTCTQYRAGTYVGVIGFQTIPPTLPQRPPLCGEDAGTCLAASLPVWKGIQDAAEQAYDRTSACGFTSFVAYEYTLSPGGANQHRNVIFRNATVPGLPITTYEAPRPIDLWNQLQATCLAGDCGCDVLAIPHNSNVSNGRMFLPEYPGASGPAEQAAQAELRARMEPLVEIFQHKGDSECVPGLSIATGAADELCGFEKVRQQQPDQLRDCGESTDIGGLVGGGCTAARDFVRGALELGLLEQARIGANPFKLGVIGSTDSHNGTPANVAEPTFRGHLGSTDAKPRDLLSNLGRFYNAGGVAAVWAEENSRDAIFAALRRRETYATSGPRITVRLFAGYGLDDGLCASPDFVAKGYAGGVPMGGDLPPPPPGAAPKIAVLAMRDPGTATSPGTQLERIQIVKAWVGDDGKAHEKVFDVAGTPGGADVDTATCKATGQGADSLCQVWTDPELDATHAALWYARVVEAPSCRWSTWVCNRLSAEERASVGCDAPDLPKKIQERAWTSPVWYVPHG